MKSEALRGELMGKIVDNQKDLEDGLDHLDMTDIFKYYFNSSKNFKFHVGTGFFFIDGFGELYPSIDINNLVYGNEDYFKAWKTKAPFLILMGKETNKTTKEALIDAQNMIKYALNTYEAEYLNFLEELLEKEYIKFKVFTDSKFHAKIYFFYDDNSIMDVYVGSANLTSAGIKKNIELTSPIYADHETREAHKKWFQNLWERATEDLNVLEIIKNYKEYNFIYYEPKKFFENLIKLMDKDYLFYSSDISDNTLLVKFQSFDFYQVMSVLEKYNGCILASSVGLGKSFVALEVMRYYENNQMEVLLIGPSNLVKGGVWADYLSRYNLKVETIGYGDLQQNNFDASNYTNYDLVVIDEAHNLRNPSNRRKNMIELLKNSPNAKYLLLTATPINIKISDLNSLIDLFYVVNEHNWLDKELKLKYEEFKTKVNKLEKSHEEPEKILKEVIELQRYVEKELIVKSTRSMVRKYFASDLEKLAGTTELPDPDVHSINYNYPKIYHEELFEQLPEFLFELNYEHSKFHLDEKEGPIYSEYRNLIYMYKWLLYKRAESSIYAFYNSIKTLKYTIQIYVAYLRNNMVPEEASMYINKERQERLKIAKIVYDTFEDEEQRKLVIKNMENDIKALSEMIIKIENFKQDMIFINDEKLETLDKILDSKGDEKCLIFTQYRDTLQYLVHNLKKKFSVDYVAGETLNGNVMKPSQKENKIKQFKENKFQHLISTDVLSEGFNIPEADVVINYDLPYNPVRIIQRVGRATRINVPKKIDILNFNPDESIDQELNLIEKLDLRISNIISMIGIDYSIWADTEEMVKERDQIDSVNKCKILKELKHRIATENPEEIYKINLREESRLDILIRDSIEHYGLKDDDLPIRKPSKPIYTTLTDKNDGFYGIYKFNKDYFEYGEPASFIQEPTNPVMKYNLSKILNFCEIIKNKYIGLMWTKKDQGIYGQKNKQLINKLKKIEDIQPLKGIINKIISTGQHTNFKIAEIINEEIYPEITKDNFIWFANIDLIDKWVEELKTILDEIGVEEIEFMDEWSKKPDEYKNMIKAFIQYKEDDSDV